MNLTEEQKEQNIAALRALMDGKPIQLHCMESPDDDWHDVSDPAWRVGKYIYRPKPAPVWTLPAPPDGKRWHRDDWTQDMLPDGWRPLLLSEKEDKMTQWYDETDKSWNEGPCYGGAKIQDNRRRTRRPLPSAPATRPWASPDDVPGPICWIRYKRQSTHSVMIVAINDRGTWNLDASESERFLSWSELAKDHEHSTDRKEWKPCTTTE